MPERALVIVPTFKECDNIARLIDAVLSQDPRLEVLVTAPPWVVRQRVPLTVVMAHTPPAVV